MSKSQSHASLGEVAMYNFLHKKVIAGNDPTLMLMKIYMPDLFEQMINTPKPEYWSAGK